MMQPHALSAHSSMNLKGAKHSATKKKRDKFLCHPPPLFLPSPAHVADAGQLLAAHRYGPQTGRQQLQVTRPSPSCFHPRV
jgi:hypothetical protein